MGEQTMFSLKKGNENINNEINSLKKLLVQKEEEIEELSNELEKLKLENNNLNLNIIDLSQQLETLKEIEKKYFRNKKIKR